MEENDDAKFLALNAEQREAACKVSTLRPEAAPTGLAQRTLARWAVEQSAALAKPMRRIFWLFRPITNPVARLAAAATIVLIFTPLMDVERAMNIGQSLEHRVFNPKVVEHMESLVDRILAIKGPPAHAPYELEMFSGDNELSRLSHRTTPTRRG